MKIRESQMIPCKKQIKAWWVGDSPKGDVPLEEEVLPAGTKCGYFRWENLGKKHTLMHFIALTGPGIFKRYRVII